MVQRETHPANRPPAPFDPLQPEVQLRGRKMKKKKAEKKKHRINGKKRTKERERERRREKAEEKSVNPGYRARLPRRLGSTSHWHSNFRPDRNLFPSGPFFSSLFFYSSPRWRPSPPTKPPANPLWCTANIRRLFLVSPPQFVFSLATPFDQYFNFAMLRYLAGPKRTGRADARERSVVVPRGGITM